MKSDVRNIKGPRARLAKLFQKNSQLVRVDDAMESLGMDRKAAAKTLARLHEQSWLQRVGHGLYAPIPIGAQSPDQVLEDPWVLVPSLFGACYIGGWSAAEHWDLTEQIFRDTLVFTTKNIRARRHRTNGMIFVLRHIQPEVLFGTRTIWRGQTRLQISDLHRTMIDMFADPGTGGGIRHVTDCFVSYLKNKDADPAALIDYAKKLGNGAVFKRMGYLASLQPNQESLAGACQELMSQGNAKLDPAIASPRLLTAWRLWVPETWAQNLSAPKGQPL